MTKEELDFIGAMNMCHEISNEAYEKIASYAEETEISEDCVSRQAVDQNIYDYAESNGLSYANMKNYILDVPPVTPTCKVGKWIEVWESQRDEFSGEYDEWREHKCSICDFQELDADRFNYCPNCGAKMER